LIRFNGRLAGHELQPDCIRSIDASSKAGSVAVNARAWFGEASDKPGFILTETCCKLPPPSILRNVG